MSIQNKPLGEIADFIRGINFKPTDVVELGTPGTIACMRTKNVQEVLDLNDVWAVNSSFIKREEQIMIEGDILISSANSWNLVGKCSWIPKLQYPASFGGFVTVLRANPKMVLPRYLYHWFSSSRIQTVVRSFGQKTTNISNLNIDRCSNLMVPLPPIDEQKRIADILDKAEEIRAMRRKTITLINSLTQSIFLEMFGDPVSNDRNWKVQKVSDFVNGFETGKSLSADDQNDLASPYRVLKISAVTSLEYKPTESKALPPNYIPPKSHFVKAGDLLFSRANTSELIGATAFVFNTPDNMLLPDKLWRFVWHETPKADPLFVWHLFRQPKFREEISRRSTGSSGSMKNISQDKVLSIEVGLPDLELQLQFSKKIQGLQKSMDAFTKSDNHLSNLFISLQSHCFSGNL